MTVPESRHRSRRTALRGLVTEGRFAAIGLSAFYVFVQGWLLLAEVLDRGALLGVALVAVGLVAPPLLAFDRPTRRGNTVFAPLLLLCLLSLLTPWSRLDSLVDPRFVPLFALALFLLHPTGWAVRPAERVDHRLVLLLVVGAVPLASLGWGGLTDPGLRPLGAVVDGAVVLGEGTGVTAAACFALVLAVQALVARHDWRFPAWGAGVVAAALGLTAVGTSGFALGDPDALRGGLVVGWAVVFVAAVERSRGGDPEF
jgi:hypothetical protein